MYLVESLLDGLKILGFDKETIKKVSKEKSLEEIFLSTLFLNYFIVLIVYIITMLSGGVSIEGREVNTPVLFGLLMIYPFVFNLVVYGVYGFFGLMAELINLKKTVKPLISVGFHTAIVFTVIFYVIGLMSVFSTELGLFLTLAFVLYFLYTMFLAIKTIYEYSQAQTLIVLFIPFLVLGLVLLILQVIYPNLIRDILALIFA